jgi:ribosomal protein S18 acetylase RimI-like enzyme
MVKTPVIRKMTEEDSIAVADLWYRLSKHHEDYHRYYAVKESGVEDLVVHVLDLLRRDCVIYVSELDERIVGFVSGYIVRRNPHLSTERVGKVDNIFVSEDSRGNGVGTQLLESLFNFYKSNGIVYIEISCDLQNAGARRLYERLGFKEQKVLMIKEV